MLLENLEDQQRLLEWHHFLGRAKRKERSQSAASSFEQLEAKRFDLQSDSYSACRLIPMNGSGSVASDCGHSSTDSR